MDNDYTSEKPHGISTNNTNKEPETVQDIIDGVLSKMLPLQNVKENIDGSADLNVLGEDQ